MPAVGNEKTEFSARIPTRLYEEFRSRFPQYGASTWFINAALETFLANLREVPDSTEQINQAIARMLEENREAEVVS